MSILLSHEETDVDKPDNNGATPVYLASEQGLNNLLIMLIYNNASLSILTNAGSTPLFAAAESGNADAVSIILDTEEGRLTLNTAWPEKGVTPLCQALNNNHTDIVAIFLTYDETDVNKETIHGSNPLYFSIVNNQEVIMKNLLAKGAKLSSLKVNPLYGARLRGHDSIVRTVLGKLYSDFNAS